MSISKIHRCQCLRCQQEAEHPDKKIHQQINLFLSRLNEQQRRWYVALQASQIGHSGISQMSQITGIDAKTIRRGQKELEAQLANRPTDRVRLPGGGRRAVEKKTRP